MGIRCSWFAGREYAKWLTATLALALSLPANAAYWSLFNVEGESSLSAQYVTYVSLADMLNDENRAGVFTPDGFGIGRNIVGSGSNGTNYWSLFNVEGESSLSAQFVTYMSLADMLNDENRAGVFTPDGFGIGRNIVGSGSNGTNYWSLFNVEGESSLSAQFVTYMSLADMLNDENRAGVFTPDGFGIGRNIVGSGSDGTTYWSLFNVEGESSLSAQFVTYMSLADMLNDENRVGVFTPDGFDIGRNIVGSGADILQTPPPTVPEPATIGLVATALLMLSVLARRRSVNPVRASRGA